MRRAHRPCQWTARRSCVTLVSDLEGAKVTTIEGPGQTRGDGKGLPPCRRRGSKTRHRGVATAGRARSCKRQRCLARAPTRWMRKSQRRWRKTSVGAWLTSVSKKRSDFRGGRVWGMSCGRNPWVHLRLCRTCGDVDVATRGQAYDRSFSRDPTSAVRRLQSGGRLGLNNRVLSAVPASMVSPRTAPRRRAWWTASQWSPCRQASKVSSTDQPMRCLSGIGTADLCGNLSRTVTRSPALRAIT